LPGTYRRSNGETALDTNRFPTLRHLGRARRGPPSPADKRVPWGFMEVDDPM